MLTKYSKEFREEALKLSDEIGSKQASEDLGIKYSTLSGWRKLRNEKQKNPSCDDDMKLQIQRLTRENNELKRANAILKDAISFFAADRKK